jgi:hypothetical protein
MTDAAGGLTNHCRKIIFSFALAVFLSYSAALADDEKCKIHGVQKNAPAICGAASQGGLVYGTARGMDVYAGDVKISMNGVFATGLDRDAPDTLKLKFCAPKTGLYGGGCDTYSYVIAKRDYVEQKVSVPPKFTEYPKDVEERIGRESAKIKRVRAESLTDTARYFMSFALPDNLKKFKISGVYGSRRVFNGQPKSPHKGVDFAAPAGTPVHPIAPGVVILAEDHYMNGNIVMVSHGHGVVSAYLHLSKISVRVGDTVDGKTVIGQVGSTGRSSGAHLHLGLYWNQIAIDPGLFVLQGGN